MVAVGRCEPLEFSRPSIKGSNAGQILVKYGPKHSNYLVEPTTGQTVAKLVKTGPDRPDAGQKLVKADRTRAPSRPPSRYPSLPEAHARDRRSRAAVLGL